jgi:hypothetical protein
MVLVEYAGDVAPKVTIAPAEPRWAPTAFPFPAMGSFDRMFEQLDRQMRAAEEAARRAPGMPGLNVASFGALPGGTSSISVITTSNGGASCARTTEVVSQGAGKPPKVTTNVTGDCGPGAATPQRAPSASSRPIDRT